MHQKIWDRNCKKNPENKIPQKFPKNSPKIGENWRKSGNYCRWEFSLKIPQKLGWGRGRHFLGKLGTNWGRGQTFYWGSLGNVPQNSPKVGVGTGKTLLGKVGDQLGTGTNLLPGNFGEFPRKFPENQVGDGEGIFGDMPHSSSMPPYHHIPIRI